MLFEIKSWLSGSVLFSLETESLNLCVVAAVLSGANLYGADLYGADLSRANLSRANLSRANLSRANLSRADLSGANLYGADLYGATNADHATAQTIILPEGDIIGWKKINGGLAKLLIPKEAKRSNSTGRKCRAEYADVIEIIGCSSGTSQHDGKTLYEVGKRVIPDSWDDNRWDECSHGIHFFITKIEAENY